MGRVNGLLPFGFGRSRRSSLPFPRFSSGRGFFPDMLLLRSWRATAGVLAGPAGVVV
jgi:hypothetical protein